MHMQLTDYFCLKYDTTIAAQLDIWLSWQTQDGASHTVTVGEQPCSFVKRISSENILYITCKSPIPLASMELTLEPHAGSIESLAIAYGVAAFDRAARDFVPAWQGTLRHDRITFVMQDAGVQIQLSMQQPVPESPKLRLEKTEMPTETEGELDAELLARIAADLAILAFYQGAAAAQAKALLESAKANRSTASALSRVEEAETLLCQLVDQSMQALRIYREHM